MTQRATVHVAILKLTEYFLTTSAYCGIKRVNEVCQKLCSLTRAKVIEVGGPGLREKPTFDDHCAAS
jgi:hypothetical protein